MSFIVGVADSGVVDLAREHAVPHATCSSAQATFEQVARAGIQFDLGLSLWWPRIIKPHLLALPLEGFVNTHPSLLPYNRGKHYNFWAIVEQAPFGVTLHALDDGIDSGDIIAQQRLQYTWVDTGASLYQAAQDAMVDLFKSTYPALRKPGFRRIPQDLSQGSLHMAAEIDPACHIDLEAQYRARDLLNLLRARTFPGHPACRFDEDGVAYEVRVSIERKE